MALLEKKTDNPKEAINLLLKAISIDADSWKSQWTLGQLYLELGMQDKAKESYTRAAALKPDSKKFWLEYHELLGTKSEGK